MTTARQVTDVVTEHGEGPFWDAAAGRLLVVDMLAGAVVAVTPAVSRYEVGRVAAAIRARAGGGYVLATERGFQLYTADFTPDGPPITAFDDPAIRMNDGGCDARGRFYCGTMAYDVTPGAGVLYRLDPDLSVHRVLTGVTISNGIQWSADGNHAYYNDTPTGRVDRYAFDPGTGTFGDRETLATIEPEHGQPDGMALDAEGGIWVALWQGGAIHRYASDGTLTARIAVPARQTTACAFDDGTTLFITTSREGLGNEAESGAGAVFAVDAGVAGARPYAFAG
ncbi:SMP-30/gluconolactonase/LRE family protein [Actinoplanes sp. CA-142083]|uniref:SMP-30/gluconolactonase/LRE family protein n=1 Tax=Actinoplanes sp. CA-142083 TaxID=3239903 RepID=UPI003D8DBC5C